jgi:CBS domain containing-hemolysin-like protein
MWWLVVFGALIGTGLFSGMETGLYFLSRVKLEVRSAHGPRASAARLLRRELEHPERLLATNLIGTIFFSDLLATAMTELMAARGYSEKTIIIANAAVLTPVLFLIVETVPKEIFRLEADRLPYIFAGFLTNVRRLLTVFGILPFVHIIARFSTRLVGGEGEAGLTAAAHERIATLLKDSASGGAMSESQAGLVDRALAFRAGSVGDGMTPWYRIRTVPSDWTREQVLRLLSREPLAFVPVVERGSDGARVVGVIRFQDAFLRATPGVGPLLLAPARLPRRMSLAQAVMELRRAQAPIGIVEDGGRAIGLVSMSDLLVPLIGLEPV